MTNPNHFDVRKIAIAIMAAALIILFALLLCSCNYTVLDTTYYFDKAIVKLPDGTIVSGEVYRWVDYDDSDMVQVTIDGQSYYTHGSNVVLIAKSAN